VANSFRLEHQDVNMHDRQEYRGKKLLLAQGWKLTARMLAAGCVLFGVVVQGVSQNPGRANATYKNPVLFADYSDPDVLRDGKNYSLISSSFEFVPGIPILQSNDLVHWTIIACTAKDRARIAFSWWKGSRPSLFAYTTTHTTDAGHVDFDWAHYKALEPVLP
jgi:hypothetical protein